VDRYAEDIEVILQKNFDKSLVTVIYLTDAVEVVPILGPLQNLKGGEKMKGISVAGIAVLSIDSTIHRQDYIHSHQRSIEIWPLSDADKPATSKHRSGHPKHSWSMLVSHSISTVAPLMSCCNAAKHNFLCRVKKDERNRKN